MIRLFRPPSYYGIQAFLGINAVVAMYEALNLNKKKKLEEHNYKTYDELYQSEVFYPNNDTNNSLDIIY